MGHVPYQGGGSTPLPLKKFFNVKKNMHWKTFFIKKNSVGNHFHEITKKKTEGRKGFIYRQ